MASNVESSSAARTALENYSERAARYGAGEQQHASRATRYSYARGVLFLAALPCLYFGWSLVPPVAVWWSAGGALLAGFVLAAALHETARRNRRRSAELRKINEESIARIQRDWRKIPLVEPADDAPRSVIADDLDLLGRASLFHLVCQARTPAGLALLRDWLLAPADPPVIQQRQQAIGALAPLLDLRETLHLRGRQLASSKAGPEEFALWSESPPWLRDRPALAWAARLIPPIGVAALVLVAGGAISKEVAGFTVLGVLLANIAISVLFTGSIHDIFNRISSPHGEVEQYRALFRLAARLPEEGELLTRIKHEITAREHGADPRLASLHRIMSLANLRHSGLTGAFYLLLQLFFLWDFHVLAVLEVWQRRHGAHVRRWFSALAELEALASLAMLAHDNTDWVFAEVGKTSDKVFRASALGHPLLYGELRVCNDVEVGPPGTLLLVTGSNMSGKSTLLRSLGVNAALAQAGGPVCAAALQMPPLAVATSMRVQDSLEDGVSFYMAELKRLKQIVDEAGRFAAGGERLFFYLLDEILLGTNSKERHIAVSRVLSHLLSQQAIGAVSTHDLELAAADALGAACVPVHFRETIHSENGHMHMTFDYKLRGGVATTSNALALLEIVGLDV